MEEKINKYLDTVLDIMQKNAESVKDGKKDHLNEDERQTLYVLYDGVRVLNHMAKLLDTPPDLSYLEHLSQHLLH